MEVNKDEAEKCLRIGAEALRRGDYERAAKFLKKSIKLFPLPGAEALLSQAENPRASSSGGPSSSASASSTRATSSTSSAAPQRSESVASSTGADGREYTEEQVRIVKQVLRSKEGGRGAHYRVLGLEQTATESEIKKAYRKLSLKVHPDKNSAPHADEAFKAVGLAYATLSDTQKRTIYDRYGEEDPDNMGGGGGPGPFGGMGRRGGGVHMHGQEVSPEEIFNMFFNGGMPGGMNGGMGGPGFRMHTTGFGPGGFHFQAGGPRQRRPAGQRGQQQREPQGGVNLGLLFQLMPLFFILLMSFFSSDSSSDYGQGRYYSLTHKAPFINPRQTSLTSVKEIPYYVTDNFNRMYSRDRYQLKQVEYYVERAYEQFLVDECDSERRFKENLQKRARKQKDPVERKKRVDKANAYELKRCAELKDLFPKRSKRKASFF